MHVPVVAAEPQVIVQSPFVVLHVGLVFAHAALPVQSIPQWLVAVQLTRSLHAFMPVHVTSHEVPAHFTPLFWHAASPVHSTLHVEAWPQSTPFLHELV